MKRVSLGGLDVSRLGLGALGTSALAENANRGDHALLLSQWRTSTRHRVRRSRRARPAMIVRPAARNRENRSRP